MAATPVTLSIRNGTGGDLECQALAAHWYTPQAVRLAPDGQGSLQFFALNGVLQTDAALPIERIFCGIAGHAWQTRMEIDLRPLSAGHDAAVLCRMTADGGACGP